MTCVGDRFGCVTWSVADLLLVSWTKTDHPSCAHDQIDLCATNRVVVRHNLALGGWIFTAAIQFGDSRLFDPCVGCKHRIVAVASDDIVGVPDASHRQVRDIDQQAMLHHLSDQVFSLPCQPEDIASMTIRSKPSTDSFDGFFGEGVAVFFPALQCFKDLEGHGV